MGYLVRWRRLASSPDLRKQLTDLLGGQASLYFANSQGDVFSDLVRPVSQPPSGLNSTMQVAEYPREGSRVMALGRPIKGTPWFVVVEVPTKPLLAEANQFLRRMLLVSSFPQSFSKHVPPLFRPQRKPRARVRTHGDRCPSWTYRGPRWNPRFGH